MTQQFRSFCFTLHVENTDQLDIRTNVDGVQVVAYYVYQFERGGATNQLHAQGFVILAKTQRMRRDAIKAKLFNSTTIHIERRYDKSTNEQARGYCMKEDTRVEGTQPIEWGGFESSNQGQRVDLDSLMGSVRDGKRMRDIREAHPMESARFARFLAEYKSDCMRSEEKRFDADVRVYVFWGSPGSGKTRRVLREVKEKYGSTDAVFDLTYSKPLWWDGYDGQEVVLIDDFGADWSRGENAPLPIQWMLRLLDKYRPIRVPVKGGFQYLMAKTVYITSNLHPDMWYDAPPITMAALARRLDHVQEVGIPEERGTRDDSITIPTSVTARIETTRNDAQ